MRFLRALPFFLVLIFGFPLFPVRSQEKAVDGSNRDFNQAAIVYRFQRGLDQNRVEWLIFPDGVVTKDQAQVGKLPKDRISGLLDEISKAGLFKMKRRYPQPACNQCASYRITVRTSKREKTVDYQDGAKNTPAGLPNIIYAYLVRAKPTASGRATLTGSAVPASR